MKNTNKRIVGIIFVLMGASFWGIGGTAANYLFETADISVNWFVSTRLVISGILLLGIQLLLTGRKTVFTIWKNPQKRLSLIIFSLLGMLLVQYSYMASIAEGNAAVATLLQYLAPIYIIIWVIFRGHQRLHVSDVIAILLTIIGTLLLLTNGSFKGLSVPGIAIVWGIISGLSLAFYTLYARNLLRFYSSVTVVGWAMIIAGVCMNIIHPIWRVETQDWSAATIGVLGFSIIFGTTLAFWMFIKSLEYLEAKETTLLGTVEPLTAVVSSIIWLSIPFGLWQVIGMALILILIVYLSLVKK
ncbi:DMT family transporter [Oceanobacillus profundus]|uniref:EamA family transporter n=1 Tax=Oceanobacillus profundus TaxID=372463 RepID=A0A417YBX9_9BACI|nr:DMT family transporter [Oceanobacillus profundus]MDO6450911.1 DMT family transporter [Oceanobacillus profundus]PAE27840.1 EamA family transporter [Paenibacillus sp. 7884-2]RHW30016.1 EamA family transporter [Oceanobacillus profundus]